MLSGKPTKLPRGFSLIELMVGVSILAILLGVVVPSFQTMLLNTQVRNAAESISNGLQRARGSAVTLNTNVNFVLGVNSSWTVNEVNPASIIASKSSNEDSSSARLTFAPIGATTITFSGLGGVTANADGSASFTQFEVTAPGASTRLRVMIGTGGNIKMCDPSIAYATNPRGC